MRTFIPLILLSLFVLTTCISQEPSEIELHTEECVYCKMVISDERFPAQLVSEKGKSYTFDSIECMAAYVYLNPERAEGSKRYLTNFTDPGGWLSIEEAAIYRSEEVPSPMGLSLFALDKGSEVPQILGKADQQTWQQTIEYVITSWEMRK